MKTLEIENKQVAASQVICTKNCVSNNESLVAFEEKPDTAEKNGKVADRLFDSFTASIIQQNTIFTR